MQTILDEEEELIAAHKRQIEETMNTVRKEMALVQEVDQPGSAIDKYVAGLSAVLAAKAASIADLQARESLWCLCVSMRCGLPVVLLMRALTS